MSEPRVRVCLTFDLDVFSSWLFATNENLPAVFSRGEYGARVGAPRLLALLERYGIPTTWFVAGHTADTYPDLVRRVSDAGHEIGHHGYCHETPSELDDAGQRRVLERGIESLQRAAGTRPVGYRAPSWDPSPLTLQLLIDRGFLYDSSLARQDHFPHFVRLGDEVAAGGAFRFGRETRLVEVPVTFILDDWEYFNYVPQGSGLPAQQGGKLPDEVYEVWGGEFDYLYQHSPGGVLTFTCHPQVSGRGPRVLMLERLIRHIREHPDVQFCTVREAAAAWLARQEPAAGVPR